MMFLPRAYRGSSHSGRLRSCIEFFKMAPVADSRFKQRALIEFLVHENESVLNIHKRLCSVYGSCAVDRSRWPLL
jgi:hypothetical protein